MDEMNHYLTPPPYHIGPPPYENTHIDKHNLPYDDYFGGYEDNYNNYEGVDDRGRDSYDSQMPPHRTPASPDFPHNEDAFHRPFSVSFWVRYFRYIPHLNLSFNRVNDTFNPKSSVYQESLGLIGCVPAVLLLYTLLMLLLYLLTRCCDHKSRTRNAITCCKVACVLSALVTLGAIGVSVWGSQEVHTGVTSVLHALSRVTAQLITLHTSTDSLTNEVRLNWQPQLSLFYERIQTHEISNMTVRDALLDQLHYMGTNISEVLLINVEDIAAKMRSPVLDELYRRVELIEQIRWASTVTLAALLMLVVSVLMLGAARHSRPTLITFSVLGLLGLIVCYALTSLYLVVSVALSDWCVDPSGVAMEGWLGSVFSKRVARYYLRCDPARSSPFTKHLTRARQSADSVLKALHGVMKLADQHYPGEMVHPSLDHVTASVKQSLRTLGEVSALLECRRPHQDFSVMVHHTCNTTMNGVVYLLLSAQGSALLFTVLVWLASHTWIYLNSKADSGSVEERDPFLPGGSRNGGGGGGGSGGGGGGGGSRGGTLNSLSGGGRGARHSHTPPQTPPFPGTLNGRLYQHHPHSGTHKSEGGMNGGNSGGGSHHHHHHHHHTATMPRDSHSHHQGPPTGPNQGQYATLSKQCKTLESSDFY